MGARGTGDCALRVAEELGFEQDLRHGAAVDHHEGLVATRACPVDRARQHFLARAALTGDEHSRIRAGDHVRLAEALFHDLPTVIAKMLGFYQIIIKNPVTGTEIKWDVLVMENLFYDRSPSRIFDLKGSMRNRKIQSTGEQNEVLLDENMVEFIYESPLFVREVRLCLLFPFVD